MFTLFLLRKRKSCNNSQQRYKNDNIIFIFYKNIFYDKFNEILKKYIYLCKNKNIVDKIYNINFISLQIIDFQLFAMGGGKKPF